MKRSEKEEIIAEMAETVGRARGLFFTDFTGLTVEQATELRREFRKSGVQYRVVKNTLIQKALENVGGFDKMAEKLVGATGVAFAFDDPVSPAKIIKQFSSKHKKLSLKACVLENELFDGSRLDELASLPTRDELMGAIVWGIQSPLGGVPNVIQSVLRDLVSVVSEIEKKKAA
ncbi:MAG: 50S ribosomal protein L10 [Bacteroidota bacterium]